MTAFMHNNNITYSRSFHTYMYIASQLNAAMEPFQFSFETLLCLGISRESDAICCRRMPTGRIPCFI